MPPQNGIQLVEEFGVTEARRYRTKKRIEPLFSEFSLGWRDVTVFIHRLRFCVPERGDKVDILRLNLFKKPLAARRRPEHFRRRFQNSGSKIPVSCAGMSPVTEHQLNEQFGFEETRETKTRLGD